MVTGAGGEQVVPPPAGDWADFYAGVRDALTGGGPMPVTAADGAQVVRVIEAARRSAESGSVVALPG